MWNGQSQVLQSWLLRVSLQDSQWPLQMLVFEIKQHPGAGIQCLVPSKAGSTWCLPCLPFQAGAVQRAVLTCCKNHLVLLLVLLLSHPRASSGGSAPVLGCKTLNSSTGCRKELFQTCRAALRTCAALRVFDNIPDLSVLWDSALTLRDRQSDTVLCLKWILASVISGCSIVTSTTNVAQTWKTLICVFAKN